MASAGKQFSGQFFCQSFNGLGVTVINISRRQAKGEDFSLTVIDKMQLKAIKPSRCAFAPFCRLSENLMIKYPFVVTDSNFGRTGKGNSGAFAETDRVREKHDRHKNTRFRLNKQAI